MGTLYLVVCWFTSFGRPPTYLDLTSRVLGYLGAAGPAGSLTLAMASCATDSPRWDQGLKLLRTVRRRIS